MYWAVFKRECSGMRRAAQICDVRVDKKERGMKVMLEQEKNKSRL